MEKIDSFTIRVYGLLIHEGKLLRLKEPFWGEILYKFPGGGLEFGEGTQECLARELEEELNLELESAELFYVQEDFIQSKFKPNEQLFTVYYKITCKDLSALEIKDKNIEEIQWIDLKELSVEQVNLPVDKIVVKKLLTQTLK